jgi:hypothetical protein
MGFGTRVDFATHLILTPTLSSAACCATRARVDWATRPCATRARVDANSCHFLLAQALATFQPRCVDVRHSLSHFLCVLRQATESLTRAPDQETFANGLAALTGRRTSSRSRSDIGTHMQRVNMFAPSDSQHFTSLRRGVSRAFWDLKTENGVFFRTEVFLDSTFSFFS